MKNSRTFYIIILIALFSFSCQEDLLINSQDSSFSIEEAKSWFETNNSPIMKLTSQSTKLSLNKANNKPIKVLFKNQWKHAFKTKKGHLEVVEVPLESNGWFSYSDKESRDAWKLTKNYGYIRSITRLVIVKNKKNKTIKSFLMTIKGSKDYLEKNRFRYKANTYLKKDKGFEGLLFFNTLEGDFVNGWQLKNGEIIGKIKTPKNNTNTYAKINETCTYYDVHAIYETCSYAHTGYEENEDGGLVATWDFIGCETSSEWVDTLEICENNEEDPIVDDCELGFDCDEGGGGNQQTDKFITDKLNTTQKELLQTAVTNLEMDCIGKALVKFVNSVNFDMGTVLGNSGEYNPDTNTIHFNTDNDIDSYTLGPELFHAYQQQLYENLDDIMHDNINDHIGGSNIEFEEKAFNLQRDLFNDKGFPFSEEQTLLLDWVYEFNINHPNGGITSLTQQELSTWFEALEVFQQFHQNSNDNYGTPIDYNIIPNALIKLINEIKETNCK